MVWSASYKSLPSFPSQFQASIYFKAYCCIYCCRTSVVLCSKSVFCRYYVLQFVILDLLLPFPFFFYWNSPRFISSTYLLWRTQLCYRRFNISSFFHHSDARHCFHLVSNIQFCVRKQLDNQLHTYSIWRNSDTVKCWLHKLYDIIFLKIKDVKKSLNVQSVVWT